MPEYDACMKKPIPIILTPLNYLPTIVYDARRPLRYYCVATCYHTIDYVHANFLAW